MRIRRRLGYFGIWEWTPKIFSQYSESKSSSRAPLPLRPYTTRSILSPVDTEYTHDLLPGLGAIHAQVGENLGRSAF